MCVPTGDAIRSITTSNVTGPRRDVDSPDVLARGLGPEAYTLNNFRRRENDLICA